LQAELLRQWTDRKVLGHLFGERGVEKQVEDGINNEVVTGEAVRHLIFFSQEPLREQG
jgi:hypothetical protein